MRILKFGGSSVGTPERISNVIDILKTYSERGIHIGVVSSAIQTVTDRLIALANKTFARNDSYKDDLESLKQIHYDAVNYLLKTKSDKVAVGKKVMNLIVELEEILHGIFLIQELTPRTLDYIESFGERLSCTIISEAMNARGFETEFLDARKVVKTDKSFGNAKVDFEETDKNIIEYFAAHPKIQIITGFIGSTENGDTTTLGRGGSDYTASILGAALNAEEIEIWTDVNGILTADPRKVNDAFSLKAVTYEEAMEMSHFGAKVIHPPTMKPALKKKIKIRIKNTFNPSHEGTLIADKTDTGELSVKGISSIDDISLLQISGSGMVGVVGISSRLFSALAKAKINIILITQASSEHSICLAVLPQHGQLAKDIIEEEFKYEIRDGMIDEVQVEPEMSIIAVVGEDMKHTPAVSGKIFQSLGKNGINIIAIAQGSSELNVSLVIQKPFLKKALNVLHDSLFRSRDRQKTVNIFLVGTGLVGGALLKIMHERKEFIADEIHAKLKVIGLINIDSMLIDEKGIEIEKWNDVLAKSGSKPDVDVFIEQMRALKLPNSILVDCTASDSVVKNYLKILGSAISIVTPNKIANTQSYSQFLALRDTAAKQNVQFKYGTNVGATLPIIASLKDMIANGDKIEKIEGVFSGTLSFIFNTLKASDSFSEVVKLAKEKGYTEPDPRDDLRGLDMARKLLILVRECGIEMELADIEVEKLISAEADQAKTLEEFYEIMKKDDHKIIERKKKAAEKGCVLCYIAKYENGKAKLSIEEIDKNHSFFGLTRSENIVAFTSMNYKECALTIKGFGAGAEYTAGGILSDILRITNYLG